MKGYFTSDLESDDQLIFGFRNKIFAFIKNL
jgi:hypothetical protein